MIEPLRVAVAGVAVELRGLASGGGAFLASVTARFGRFAPPAATATRLVLTVDATRPEEPAAELPSVTLAREGASETFVLAFGPLSARIDRAAGVGHARMSPEPSLVDTLVRVALTLALVERRALLVHASAVVAGDRAFAFFGPSGAGKTTVARAARAEDVLSDEIVALSVEDEGVWAHGTPFAGELGVSQPRAAPLALLARLRQAPVDALRALPPAEAVGSLLGSTLFFARDLDAAAGALAVAADLAGSLGGRLIELSFRRETDAPRLCAEWIDG